MECFILFKQFTNNIRAILSFLASGLGLTLLFFMRNNIFIILLLIAACKPYEDPEPITDPRINNPYCNDPAAINFNWGFPGVPDNSQCFYPADVFEGNYVWQDSTLNDNGAVIAYDSIFSTINKIDSTRFEIIGRCNANVKLTASRFLTFTIDTIVGDGQIFCRATDTIAGSGMKVGVSDTSTFFMNYSVITDTGTTTHKAKFVKQ